MRQLHGVTIVFSMAKRSKKKSRAKSDRGLLELGEDLLGALHLHQAVQDDEARAALASAHPDLVRATGDLVTRIAERFLDDAGIEADGRGRHAGWAKADLEVQSRPSSAADDAGPSH